jgi:hypothetical protein
MRTLMVLGMLSLLGGCSKSAPAPGKAVPIENVCNEADDSRVRLTGYLRYRRGLLSFCSSYGGKKTCDLTLYAGAEKPPDYNIMRPQTGPEPVQAKISVPVGDDPGEMDDLPKEFSESDVVVHLPDKGKATEGTRITVDGKLNVIPGDPKTPAAPKSCYVTVEWASPG